MTVGELIEFLKEFDSTDLVMVDGYEGGVDDLEKKNIQHRCVQLHTNKKYSYFGLHDVLDPDFDIDEDDVVEAVILRRSSH